MFPSGRTFIAQCASVIETLDGAEDVALMVLGTEITPGVAKRGAKSKAASSGAATSSGVAELPVARIASEAVARCAGVGVTVRVCRCGCESVGVGVRVSVWL